MTQLVPTVLIDVDGTISDSLPGIQAGFRLAMAAIDHEVPDDDFMSRLAGPPMLDTLASLGLDDDRIQRAMAAYMRQQAAGGWAQTKMFAGWPELLQSWKEAGFQLSTATTKGHYYAEKVLELFEIRQHFDFVSAADPDKGLITKSDVIRNALGHFGLSTEGSATGVVMIGDRTHDFSGAHQFGIPAIAVEWGYGDDHERREATRTATNMQALDKEVRELLYL